jgi:hypothetical protein
MVPIPIGASTLAIHRIDRAGIKSQSRDQTPRSPLASLIKLDDAHSSQQSRSIRVFFDVEPSSQLYTSKSYATDSREPLWRRLSSSTRPTYNADRRDCPLMPILSARPCRSAGHNRNSRRLRPDPSHLLILFHLPFHTSQYGKLSRPRR